MLFAQCCAAVTIVIENCQLGTPSHPHGKARSQQDPNNGLQAVRPTIGWSQRRRGPVESLDQLAHPFRLQLVFEDYGNAAAGSGNLFLHLSSLSEDSCAQNPTATIPRIPRGWVGWRSYSRSQGI